MVESTEAALGLFYQKLQKRKNSLTVFNPYREAYKLANLQAYLNAMQSLRPRLMLVGEAPGFKGCRLTGIPFSSAKLYTEVEHPFLIQLRERLVLPQLEAENTAAIVWRYLRDKNAVPLFWNAFPYHPHPSRIQKKNRAPTKAEIIEGGEFLTLLADIFQPEVVAGLGRKGVEAARLAFPEKEIRYIRHPSYGGKSDFITGMDQLFKYY